MKGASRWGKKRVAGFVLTCLVGSVLILNFLSGNQAGAETSIDSIVYEGLDANSSGSRVVFISDQVGYAFYQNVDRSVAYSKTTNGGSTWGSAVTVDSQTDTLGVVVWYDRWTPSDTTGNYIHILTKDEGSADLWYIRLDTANSDTLTSPVSVSSSPAPAKTSTINAGDEDPISLVKATDGVLYAGMNDSGTSGGFVVKCSSTCTGGGNWSDTGSTGLGSADVNWMGLIPTASGNVMLIEKVEAVDDLRSKIYNGSSWAGSWTDINTGTLGSVAYGAAQMGLSVSRDGSEVYLVYCNDTDTLGTNDDIKTAIYSGGSWTAGTDVLTNDSKGITDVKIAVDENSGDIYVAYTALTTPATITTGNVYWKKSTDNMSTWGSEQGPINTGAEEINTLAINITSNERLYATWNKNNGASDDTYHGENVVNLVSNTSPSSPTLIAPSSGAGNVRGYPAFQLRATDAENDYLRYKIDVCSTSNCSAVVRTIDQTASQTGWTGQDQASNTAYTGSSTLSGSTIAIHNYQVPGLTASTQYWWRAYAIDPTGSNTFSSASSIIDFTIGPTVNVEVRGGSNIQGGGSIR